MQLVRGKKEIKKKKSPGGPIYKSWELQKGERTQRQEIQQNSIQFLRTEGQEFPN